MKHCIAPSLFTQSELQFDPLAILGLPTAPCGARTSTIAASSAITMPERLMLRLPAFENPSMECTPVRASGPGSVKSSDHSRLAFPCATKLDLSIRCPLYPRKRTLSDTTGMSALCQKRTYAAQQKN